MRKKLLALFLALAVTLTLVPFTVLAEETEGDETEGSGESPAVQVIRVRGNGPEDENANANYGEAYKEAGLTLSEQPADGVYTLTIDKEKLDAIVKAGKDDDTYKVLENANNPGKLWFGMEYIVPEGIVGSVECVSVRFDDSEEVKIALNAEDGKGFYNYIKVYDGDEGKIGPVDGETAIIQWLDTDDKPLATTKAVVKVEVKETYTVTFMSDADTVGTASVLDGGKVTKPSDPTRDGYTFGGWYTEEACTTLWNFDEGTVTEDITLYAKWVEGDDVPGGDDGKDDGNKDDGEDDDGDKDDGDDDDNSSASSFTITFNGNGGKVSTETMKTGEDGKLAKLPEDPTYEGYTFEGWYTTASGGDKVDTNTVFDKAATVYAHWTKTGSSTDPTTPSEDPDEYSIRVRSGQHGTVTVSSSYAEPGTKVTITVDPESDYRVDSIEVERENGRSISYSQSGRRYTFTMPASNVTVTVSFALQAVYATYYYQPLELEQTVYMPAFTPVTLRSAAALPDIPTSSWSYLAAQWAYQNGYLDLAAGGVFNLNATVSHQEMWKIMAQWLGAPVTSETAIMNWARQNGAARGQSATAAMTRQNVVVYLYQCYFLMGGDTSVSGNLSAYSDSRLITADSVKNAWIWAVNKGIISGTSDGYLNPNTPVTRGEFAVMLMRMCQMR